MTFCVAPWYALEQGYDGHRTACCFLPAAVDIQEVRQAMLDGQRPKACSACWRIEDAGQISHRQRRNQELDVYWNVDISEIERQVRNGQYAVRMLKLFTSNLCNSTCVTCSPSFSSSWQRLARRDNSKFVIRPYTTVQPDDISCDLSQLKTLSLLGGEPLYESANFRLLEKLKEIGNTDLFVSIVTNGGVRLTDQQRDILGHFKNVNFCLSIDGTDRLFEYLRYPLQWQTLLDNIQVFRSITDNISASYTISNLNIQEHPKTTAWFRDNKIPFNYSPVTYPNYFSPQALPEQAKQQLSLELDSKDYHGLVGEHHSAHDTLYQEACSELDRQDRLKGINRQDFLPDHSFFIKYQPRHIKAPNGTTN